MMKYLIFNILLLLSDLIFSIKIVQSRKDRKTFNKIWVDIWIKEGYHSLNLPKTEIERKLINHFEKYNNFSNDYLLFFLIWPIGTFRITNNNNVVGLPIATDFELPNLLNKKRFAEITLFTLKKEFRGYWHLASLQLMKAVFHTSAKMEIDEIGIESDERFFFLCKKTGLVLNQLVEKKFFEGSVTYPCLINFKETLQSLKTKQPILYNFFKP